jgi:hypothetical protein
MALTGIGLTVDIVVGPYSWDWTMLTASGAIFGILSAVGSVIIPRTIPTTVFGVTSIWVAEVAGLLLATHAVPLTAGTVVAMIGLAGTALACTGDL